MNTLKIGSALCSLLGDINSFPLLAPTDTPAPFVTYTLTGLRTASTKDRYSYREIATVTIQAVGTTYAASAELAQEVRQRLEPVSGDVQGFDIDAIQLANASASVIGDLYTHTLTYNVIIL